MQKKLKKQQVSFEMPEEDLKRLDAIVKTTGLSRSDVIRGLIADYVKKTK